MIAKEEFVGVQIIGATRRSRTRDHKKFRLFPAVGQIKVGFVWVSWDAVHGQKTDIQGRGIRKRIDPLAGFSVLLPWRDYMSPSIAIGIYSTV